MSSGTVSNYKCAWCGFTAPATTSEQLDAEFLPAGWAYLDGEELCVGCLVWRRLAIERAKSERKDINVNKGSSS